MHLLCAVMIAYAQLKLPFMRALVYLPLFGTRKHSRPYYKHKVDRKSVIGYLTGHLGHPRMLGLFVPLVLQSSKQLAIKV